VNSKKVRIFLIATALFTAMSSLVAAVEYEKEAPSLPSAGTPVLDKSLALPDGYEELTSQETGITGLFKADGQSIRYETRRGPRTPLVLRRGDPATPPYEIDVRFLDSQGRLFLVQYGGHGPVDDSWTPGVIETKLALNPATDEEARSNFKAAEKALSALQSIRFDKRYAPEYAALVGLLPMVREMEVPSKSEDISLAPFSSASTCTYKNKVDVRYQPCCAPLAQHSATIASNISTGGTTTQAWVSCNHGTCASQMSSSSGTWTSAANRCTLPSIAPLCATPYGLICGMHVCNDDSWVQMMTVELNGCPAAPTCNDCSLRIKAPTP
jgi:hypothetical protein